MNTEYAATPFFVNGGFIKNWIEWCEENYLLYYLWINSIDSIIHFHHV
jgi:hypothetical protein